MKPGSQAGAKKKKRGRKKKKVVPQDLVQVPPELYFLLACHFFEDLAFF